MRWLAIPFLLINTLVADVTEVVRVPPWELHNSFWMSLHQSLIADAMRSSPRDLNGKGTLEEAIDKVVGAIKR